MRKKKKGLGFSTSKNAIVPPLLLNTSSFGIAAPPL